MGRLTFLAPITGLIAGAIGAGLVLLMYMLRLRRRPVQVSSTMLWQRAVRDLEGNIPWQKLSPSLLLLVHLLIVALLAMALARPVAESDLAEGQRVVLVIDSSASMSMRLDEGTALQRAKRDAADRVRALFDSGRTARVSVIDAGLEPRIVLRDARERGRVLGAIDGIEGDDQPGRIEDALGLIEELQRVGGSDEEGERERSTLVWVYSDGGSIEREIIPLTGASGVLVPSVRDEDAVSNAGIVSISAQRDRVDTDLCRVFVRVRRSDAGPRAAVVRVFDAERVIDSAPVAFEDGQPTATHSFELRMMRGGLLRAELAGSDALASDDRAWVRVPDPDPIRVTIIAPGGVADPLLLDSIEVVARAPARVIAPGEAVGEPDLLIYDRVDALALPSVPSLGFGSVTPGISARLEQATGIRRVLSWDRGDSVLRDAGVGSISFRRSVEFGTEERVLARDRDGALIVELAQQGVRHVRVGFALHDSDWSVQVGFTIFLAQLCEQLLPGAGGQGEVVRTDTVVGYLDDEGVERSFGPVARVGLATLPDGREVGVSLLSDAESSLRTRQAASIGSGDAGRAGAIGRVRLDLWRWFVAGAIVLLLIEWVLYLLRVRVSL